MSKRRTVAGGAVAVEVPPDRLVGWVNRFAGRNDGLTAVATDGLTVTVTGGDGTVASIDVPFGPMTVERRASRWKRCWRTWRGSVRSG